jgi:transmembrane protein 222
MDSLEPVKIAPRTDHFPVCVVWTPLPLLSWLVPFVGHLGIATSDGTLHDFAGSYYIRKHPTSLAFGPVCKYVPIDLAHIKQALHSDYSPTFVWDRAVQEADHEYEHMTHNLLCNNCHSHVAMVLNRLQYKGFTHWNTVTLIAFVVWHGKWVSAKRMLMVWAPFLLISICVLLFALLGGNKAHSAAAASLSSSSSSSAAVATGAPPGLT